MHTQVGKQAHALHAHKLQCRQYRPAAKTSRSIVRTPQPCIERERQRATVTRSRQSSQKPRTAGGSESHSCSNQSVRKNVWRPVASAASGLGATLLWMMGRGLKIASPSHEVLYVYRHSTVASTCKGTRYIQYRTVLCTKPPLLLLPASVQSRRQTAYRSTFLLDRLYTQWGYSVNPPFCHC